MEINRNQYLMAGLVILLLGVQLRYVESYVLNERCSRFIAKRFDSPQAAAAAAAPALFAAPPTTPPAVRRTLRPPKWLGYALLSVGGVLTLHSLAMRRPD